MCSTLNTKPFSGKSIIQKNFFFDFFFIFQKRWMASFRLKRSLLTRFLDAWPGKQFFGIYRYTVTSKNYQIFLLMHWFLTRCSSYNHTLNNAFVWDGNEKFPPLEKVLLTCVPFSFFIYWKWNFPKTWSVSRSVGRSGLIS